MRRIKTTKKKFELVGGPFNNAIVLLSDTITETFNFRCNGYYGKYMEKGPIGILQWQEKAA